MEDKVFEKMFEWTAPYQNGELITLGRDINALALSYNAEGTFAKTYSFTHCPLVNKDAVLNFQRYGQYPIQHRHCDKEELGAAVLALQGDRPLVVALTSGRHGLKDSLIEAFKAKRNIVQVIYNSCNPVSLVRDMEKFLAGSRTFGIADFHSFDFFPGTKYVSTITKLTRRPRALVLPVGPAGTGKSFLAARLHSTLPKGSFSCFERDRVFADLRAQGCSLKATAQRTHAAMRDALQHCPTDVLYLDSTNGNAEARRLYVSWFRPDVLIYVLFEPPADPEAAARGLTDRTMRRTGHPSFPVERDEQLSKHQKILMGLQWPEAAEAQDAVILRCDALDDHTKAHLDWEVFKRVYATVTSLHPGTSA